MAAGEQFSDLAEWRSGTDFFAIGVTADYDGWTTQTCAAFVPMKKFAGAKPDLFFSTGQLGLGYYRDVPKRSETDKPQVILPPVQLRLKVFVRPHSACAEGSGCRRRNRLPKDGMANLDEQLSVRQRAVAIELKDR